MSHERDPDFAPQGSVEPLATNQAGMRAPGSAALEVPATNPATDADGERVANGNGASAANGNGAAPAMDDESAGNEGGSGSRLKADPSGLTIHPAAAALPARSPSS